jgi:hypothetical protein
MIDQSISSRIGAGSIEPSGEGSKFPELLIYPII